MNNVRYCSFKGCKVDVLKVSRINKLHGDNKVEIEFYDGTKINVIGKYEDVKKRILNVLKKIDNK